MCLGNGRDPSSPTLWVTPIATRAAALAKSPNRSQWTKNKNKSEIVSEVSWWHGFDSTRMIDIHSIHCFGLFNPIWRICLRKRSDIDLNWLLYYHLLTICWWYADWLVMSRVYEPRPRKFVSKGAKPRYPKLHRGVEIVGPGNDSNGNGKCSTSCCTASSQPYLDWNPFFNWSRRSWLKPLSPQCSHVLPHVRCLSHCHPAKRPGENESPLQAQLWSCVGYNVYNIFVPCITHIANMLRICCEYVGSSSCRLCRLDFDDLDLQGTCNIL